MFAKNINAEHLRINIHSTNIANQKTVVALFTINREREISELF